MFFLFRICDNKKNNEKIKIWENKKVIKTVIVK